ncbi:hypothetical protein JB92DRAFT_3143613 [Gautieria morchelliformis]|nr:hypothetical protein JB92DRAFT_3143613 [Gautieria morchelliformis]
MYQGHPRVLPPDASAGQVVADWPGEEPPREQLAPPGGGGGGNAAARRPRSRGTSGAPPPQGRAPPAAYARADTLAEPIAATIAMSLPDPAPAPVQVLYSRPAGSAREVLRDWDLWGPLVLCLLLGVMLRVNAPQAQSLRVFMGVIVSVSAGSPLREQTP